MKHLAIFLFAVIAVNLATIETVEAQDVSTAVTAQVAAASTPQVAAPVASAVAVPAGQPVVVPAGVSLAPSQAAVAVPAVSAPPAWATVILTTVANLPVVGPYVSQLLLWLGILAAILTTLVGAVLTILASLKGAFKWAGLDTAVAAITAFQAGPIMYWLTYFSNFNAKKPSA